MNNLLVVYSNLGIGGVPKKIVDITREHSSSFPQATIHILLQKHVAFSFPIKTTAKTTIAYCDLWSPYLFVLQIIKTIFQYNPSTVLPFISSYALPVLLCKCLFFWRRINVVIGEDHMTSTVINTMRLPWIQKLGIRLLYPKADTILVPTNAIKQDLVIHFSIPGEKIVVIHNWTKVPPRLVERSRPVDIIYVGRFDKTKNLPTLLSVVTHIKSTYTGLRVALLGDGPEKSTLKSLIHKHRLDSNVSIQTPTLNAGSYLRLAKILFYASGDTEGMPLAILEAMAHGCVVVSTHFRGAEETIQDKKVGFLVNTSDEMARVALRLLTNNQLRSSIAKSAYSYVKKHHNAQTLCSDYAKNFI